MQEYYDGILLYEVMMDKVWNKVVKDIIGLKGFYELYKFNYQWSMCYNVMVYECKDVVMVQQVSKLFMKSDIIFFKIVLSVVNKDLELNLKVKINKYEVDNILFLKGCELKKGVNLVYEFDGKYYVVKVDEVFFLG